jgi:hypothetical protein
MEQQMRHVSVGDKFTNYIKVINLGHKLTRLDDISVRDYLTKVSRSVFLNERQLLLIIHLVYFHTSHRFYRN